MRKTILLIVSVFCTACLAAGCLAAPAGGAAQSADAPSLMSEHLSEWPDNRYTQAIPRPRAGMPDYAVYDETDGYYSLFLKEISREQGELYIETLKENGFHEIAGDSNSDSAGIVLRKDGIHLGVSITEGGLGLYIAFES